MIICFSLLFHASFKGQIGQEVELLHSLLPIVVNRGLKMLLMGVVQATGTRGPYRAQGMIIDPGGE